MALPPKPPAKAAAPPKKAPTVGPKAKLEFPPNEKPPAPDADWAQKLYTPDRIKAHAEGKITTSELHMVTWYELLDIANRAFAYFNEGKYKEAGTLFRGLVTLEPKEAYYRMGLGAVYLAEDHLEAAKTLFDQAIELNPKELAAYRNRGETQLRLGQVMDAALDFQRALELAKELDPKGTDAEVQAQVQQARMLAAAALETIEAAEDDANKRKK
jgi:tetratricopeptide (TPR) repeat protein